MNLCCVSGTRYVVICESGRENVGRQHFVCPRQKGGPWGCLLAPLGWGLHSVGSEEDRQRESMREGSGMSLLQFDEKCACPEMKL